MSKPKLVERIQIKLSTWEKNRIRHYANIYANGNISLYLIGCGLKGNPLFLDDESLGQSKRRSKKGAEDSVPQRKFK